MFNVHKESFEWGGRTLTLETGKIARQADGSVLATVLWFASTTIFGWYLRHYADYGVIYGSVGTAIALLVWLYLVSLVILIGAEFNAARYPRYLFGSFSKLDRNAAGEGKSK